MTEESFEAVVPKRKQRSLVYREKTQHADEGESTQPSPFRESLENYASSACFSGSEEFVIADDPFHRPVRRQDIKPLGLASASPLAKEQYRSALALLGHRLLTNVYEQDLMFLPEKQLDWNKYQEFYSSELRKCGDAVRPSLETLLFDYLESEIEVGGTWTLADFREHCEGRIADVANGGSKLLETVLASNSPEGAAKYFAIQCASDFLSEASAMARNCLGSYGPHISELFKILIDEYGYGVHRTKHSQAYADLLASIGLESTVHHYWQFYTASSLSLVNYFHYICKNHGRFFRYLGALYYTEATLAHVTKHQTKMLKTVFGENVNTFYFDEHTHIDKHHGRMAYENLIAPIVAQYGDGVLPDILRGFEECKLIQDLADEDMAQQMLYGTSLEYWKTRGGELLARQRDLLPAGFVLRESKNELSVMHCHDSSELLIVLSGELEFMANPLHPTTLKAGEAIVIPRYMHHGSRVLSEACSYRVVEIYLE